MTVCLVEFDFPSYFRQKKKMLIAPISTGGAGIEPEKTTLVFSWATSVGMVSSFFLGFILDTFGPRISSVVSCLIIAIGSYMLAESNNFAQFATGACAVAFGGPGVGVSIIHIANLFPSIQNLTMSCLNGSIAISFSVLNIFAFMWERFEFANFYTLFRYYSVLATALAVGAFFLYPDEPFKTMEDGEVYKEEKEQVEVEEEGGGLAEIDHLIIKSSTSSNSNPASELGVIHENRHHDVFDDHDHIHIQSVAPSGPSLKIGQPLNSGLRANCLRTESFLLSKEAMETEDPEAEAIISLKDRPFFKQLCSASYLRSSFIFWISTFVTNFYVSSISTELADLGLFSSTVQHELAKTFTSIMSSGIMASIFVGYLIDKFGVKVCTAMTFIFGQLQMIILLFFSKSHTMTVVSFFCYTMYRSTLYPVFIASLTSRLGFKYFGILLGIGFAISGIVQLLMAPLNDAVQGDCHLDSQTTATAKTKTDASNDENCFEGLWISLHLLQLSVLLALMIIPYMDYRSRLSREAITRGYRAKPTYGGTDAGLSLDAFYESNTW
jgi:MFS family permease